MKREDYLYIYSLVFDSAKSDGFKISEMIDLLTYERYWFAERPLNGWIKRVEDYIKANDFDFDYSRFDKWR